MALDKQIYIYSVDTEAFLFKKEKLLKREIYKHKKSDKLKAKELEKSFRDVIDANIHKQRELDPACLNLSSKVSVFESALTRTLGFETNNTYEDIIIVETNYYSIFDSLIEKGFTLNGLEYVVFTASAGQIRTKKAVFMLKEKWDSVKLSLMCGLTEDKINAYYEVGKNKRRNYGVSINKYLAYLALCTSATDIWQNFNIDRAIVVDDFESSVSTIVDFVDDVSYTVERKLMDIPINHTDGCGMILPQKNKKAFMTRLPWIKGLLVPFPFDVFTANKNTKIIDIYGKEYDIIKDKIEVIFTKSQFKMWKYYRSWAEYKKLFKLHRCQANIGNIEEDNIIGARLCYQMLQTLTTVSQVDLENLSSQTKMELHLISSDPDAMLKLLGVTNSDFDKKNYLQQALYIYPDLLKDSYVKQKVKEAKASLFRKAYAGKIKVDGCYTFVAPDLYAFCEWLFDGNTNPQGLLVNGEVSCSGLPSDIEVDCLRSPHLYKEHAVRTNKVNADIGKWFISSSVHTSIHDPISKILMFDCDGDKITVSNDKTLVKVAKANMIDITPLYYDMKKAPAEKITCKSIKDNLKRAFSGNIGIISNDITKIWNSSKIDINLIKLRTMENNFEIDAAKTNYKPTRPAHIREMFRPYNKEKMPYFFTYEKYRSSAQDVRSKKKKRMTQPWNEDNTVNRLKLTIPETRISFKESDARYSMDHKLLMSKKPRKDNTYNQVIEKYKELNDIKWRFSHSNKKLKSSDTLPVYQEIRNELLGIRDDPHYIANVLVDYIYENSTNGNKTTLWSSFGDILVENLKVNMQDKLKICRRCGTVISNVREKKKKAQIYCSACAVSISKSNKSKRNERYRMNNLKKDAY